MHIAQLYDLATITGLIYIDMLLLSSSKSLGLRSFIDTTTSPAETTAEQEDDNSTTTTNGYLL